MTLITLMTRRMPPLAGRPDPSPTGGHIQLLAPPNAPNERDDTRDAPGEPSWTPHPTTH
jgi:hypothetical protein